jgi:hypothetical protein
VFVEYEKAMEFKSQIDNLEVVRKNLAALLQQNGVQIPSLNVTKEYF